MTDPVIGALRFSATLRTIRAECDSCGWVSSDVPVDKAECVVTSLEIHIAAHHDEVTITVTHPRAEIDAVLELLAGWPAGADPDDLDSVSPGMAREAKAARRWRAAIKEQAG